MASPRNSSPIHASQPMNVTQMKGPGVLKKQMERPGNERIFFPITAFSLIAGLFLRTSPPPPLAADPLLCCRLARWRRCRQVTAALRLPLIPTRTWRQAPSCPGCTTERRIVAEMQLSSVGVWSGEVACSQTLGRPNRDAGATAKHSDAQALK